MLHRCRWIENSLGNLKIALQFLHCNYHYCTFLHLFFSISLSLDVQQRKKSANFNAFPCTRLSQNAYPALPCARDSSAHWAALTDSEAHICVYLIAVKNVKTTLNLKYGNTCKQSNELLTAIKALLESSCGKTFEL